jgi:hypothetical protein
MARNVDDYKKHLAACDLHLFQEVHNVQAADQQYLPQPTWQTVAHGLNVRSSVIVDPLVRGHLALFDQIHHGQKPLPVLDYEAGKFVLVHFPFLANAVVAFLYGGSTCIRFDNLILSEPGQNAAELSTTAGTSSNGIYFME